MILWTIEVWLLIRTANHYRRCPHTPWVAWSLSGFFWGWELDYSLSLRYLEWLVLSIEEQWGFFQSFLPRFQGRKDKAIRKLEASNPVCELEGAHLNHTRTWHPMALDPHPPSCTFPRTVSVPFPLGAFCWSLKAFGRLVTRGFWDALCLVAAEALWPVPHLFSVDSPSD